jgi:F0F1-type ATP synthase assembly protein I
MTDKDERRVLFRELGRYGALGLEMGISVFIGMAIGWWLDGAADRYLGWKTAPWQMVAWIGFGFAAGIRSLWRSAMRAQREADEQDKKDGKPGGD